ncbi:MAG: SLC13 family permease [Thermodesulfobacteriota bacterium]
MTQNQTVTLVVFAATYLALIVRTDRKLPIVAVAAAVLLLWPGLMHIPAALHAINWNVVMLYFGMLLLSETFILSQAPAVLTEWCVREGHSARTAFLLICGLCGLISMVIENVAAVLIVAPLALSMAKRLRVSPVPLLIGIAVSSNLQGAATLIGDPPSMLLAGSLGLNFNDFFWYKDRLGIFFAVEFGAAISLLVLWLIFRKHDGRVPRSRGEKLDSYIPPCLLVLLIVALASASILLPDWEWGTGTISLAIGCLAALWWIGRHGAGEFRKQAMHLDWATGFFLVGIFMVVGSLVENGLVEKFVQVLEWLSGGSPLQIYFIIVAGSVLGSAIIDNVPFVAAMLPVCIGLATRLAIPPELLSIGMMIGASIGGNITPIGASANIVAVGIAKREGYEITFTEFIHIGLPFTIAATVAASTFVWFVWR